MVSKFQSWWQKIKQHRVAIGVVAIVTVVVIILIIAGYWFDWTGFNKSIGPQLKPNQQYRPEKTVWDWLQLLIIPGVLAVVGFFFTRTERRNEQVLAKDSQQEAALQGYLDRMAALLLEKNLRDSQPDDEVRTVARVRTLTMLFQLDTRRINYMLAFLRESKLVTADTRTSIITFSGADLRNANLQRVDFHGIDLSVARLSEANLSRAIIYEANLNEAKLYKTNLSNASFYKTNLSNVSFYKTNLSNASLIEANLSGASLIEANLSNARLREANLSNADLSHADLSRASIHKANLSKANLERANLERADLRGANLRGANLRGANLSKAHLNGATLQGAKYNTKAVKGWDVDGKLVSIEPTQWPQGFDPKAAAAICVDGSKYP